MEAQGYKVRDNVLYQEIKSSILLEKNGKASSGKRTKHINIRYFFITDRIAKGEVSVSVAVPNRRHDWGLRNKTAPRCSVLEVQRPNHGSGSGKRSGAG